MSKREKRIIRLSAAGSVSMLVLLILSAVYAAPATENKDELKMPYAIADTDLVLLRLTGYEGLYLEDASMEEVVDVAAAVLWNRGNRDLAGVKLCICCQGVTYRFRGYDIPAGAAVTLLDLDKKTYDRRELSACYATAWPATLQDCRAGVMIREISEDTVELINCSKRSWSGLELCYKNYLQEKDCYMGGFTHRVTVEELPSGASVQIYLPFYLSGYSKIVRLE